ncbi:hypothetical protein [Nonomuraea sp. NPDC049784]|uniref:hypothetical protein n=1 Tax=Nonomuraea sp. NPDC049784 TaxID=3154361 RepID=UPI0033FB2069
MSHLLLRGIVLASVLLMSTAPGGAVALFPAAAPATPLRPTMPTAGVAGLIAVTVHAQGRVRSHGVPLAVRAGPGAGYPVIGHRLSGSLIDLAYSTRGSSVEGDARWYRLADGPGFVSARYILSGTILPRREPSS